MDRIDIDQIDDLHAKATPGEWVGVDDSPDCIVVSSGKSPWTSPMIAGVYEYGEGGIAHPADVPLICSLKNSWPALRDELQRLREVEAYLIGQRVRVILWPQAVTSAETLLTYLLRATPHGLELVEEATNG